MANVMISRLRENFLAELETAAALAGKNDFEHLSGETVYILLWTAAAMLRTTTGKQWSDFNLVYRHLVSALGDSVCDELGAPRVDKCITAFDTLARRADNHERLDDANRTTLIRSLVEARQREARMRNALGAMIGGEDTLESLTITLASLRNAQNMGHNRRIALQAIQVLIDTMPNSDHS